MALTLGIILIACGNTSAELASVTATAAIASKIEISAENPIAFGTLNVGVQGTTEKTVTVSSNKKWDLLVSGGDNGYGGKMKATYSGSAVYATNPMMVEVDSNEKTIAYAPATIVSAAEHGKDVIKTAKYKQTFDYADPVPDDPGTYSITITWTAQFSV
jgi:hypothetical protein